MAIYQDLAMGGARRAAYEIGRRLAERHEVHLYRLDALAAGELDLASHAAVVHTIPYSPLGGRLDSRLRSGHLAPRSYTLFGPLKRAHRQLAASIRAGGHDVVLAHTDGMTQSPYLLRWLGDLPSVYYCPEVLRVAYDPEVMRWHRRTLKSSVPIVGTLRMLEDASVIRR